MGFWTKLVGPFQHVVQTPVLIREVLHPRRFEQYTNAARYVAYHLSGSKAVRLPFSPLAVTIYITNRCNLECKHCCQSMPQTQGLAGYMMDEAEFQKSLDYPFVRRAMGVGIQGGEPLLHPKFVKFVHMAAERKHMTRTITAGLLLDKRGEELVSSPLSSMNISFDATNRDDYEVLRDTKDHFDQVLNNTANFIDLRNRKKSKLHVSISFVLTTKTIHRMDEMVELGLKLGVDCVRFQNINIFPIQGDPQDAIFNDDVEFQLKKRSILQKYGWRISLAFPYLVPRQRPQRGCRELFYMLGFNKSGAISPCCFMTVLTPSAKPVFGSIHETDPWNADPLMKLRRAMVDHSVPLPKFCEMCPLLSGKTG